MPRRIEVAAGQRYGRLVFIEELSMRCHRRRGLFQCDCGARRDVAIHDVRSGHTRSCGCLWREIWPSAPICHGATRGRASTPEYRAWKAMKGRCYDQNNVGYANYGGRGIRVYDPWRGNFAVFLADVGARPSPDHTIDRIDNDGHYKPGNVRWALRVLQSRNRRNNRWIELKGERRIIADWALISGVPEESIASRLRNGWDPHQAVFRPVKLRSGAADG